MPKKKVNTTTCFQLNILITKQKAMDSVDGGQNGTNKQTSNNHKKQYTINSFNRANPCTDSNNYIQRYKKNKLTSSLEINKEDNCHLVGPINFELINQYN